MLQYENMLLKIASSREKPFQTNLVTPSLPGLLSSKVTVSSTTEMIIELSDSISPTSPKCPITNVPRQ